MASIFKAYDIRGVYPSELNDEIAEKIGKAFVKKFKPKNVLVGNDMRSSSPSLFNALAKGITSQGANVHKIGLTTTPMMYYATAKFGFDAGITITASHNPAQYNGMKMVRKGAVPIGGDTGIYEIEKMVKKNIPDQKIKGEIKEFTGAKDAYIAQELSFVDVAKIKPLKIAIDTANGMGGLVAKELFAKTKCKITPLFFELDGTFPNHEANPVKDETLEVLRKTMKKQRSDVGIAFDGDCDRVFLLDEKGEKISADILGAALIPEIMLKKPKAKVLANVTCSWVIKEEVEKAGGSFAECPVGHSLIKAQMRKDNADFAIEFSGHFFLKENYYLESPFAIALMMLERLSITGKKLSELIKPYKRYFSTGEINFEVEDKAGAIKRIEKELGKGSKRKSKMDGLKLEYEDFWFNVRPSNTEPLLRLNLEAKTQERLDEMRDKITKLIQ